MKFFIGKAISESKTLWVPEMFFFGGYLFINWLRRSVMIPLSENTQLILQNLGIDTIGD